MKPQQNLNTNEAILACRLYVMCGVAGSGKSTFARDHLCQADHIVHISRDEVRMSMLKPGEHYFSKEKEVYAEFIKRIVNAANEGYTIVVDATHLNHWSRDKLTKSLDEQMNRPYEIIYVVMNTEYHETQRRNAERTGRALVPADVIDEMFEQWESPRYSEHPNIKGIWTIN